MKNSKELSALILNRIDKQSEILELEKQLILKKKELEKINYNIDTFAIEESQTSKFSINKYI